MRPLLALLLIALGVAGCRTAAPFEPGDARYTFDVRAEPAPDGGYAGMATVADTASRRRLRIERFRVEPAETATFTADDPETGARLELAVTADSGGVTYEAVIRRDGRLVATHSGVAREGD